MATTIPDPPIFGKSEHSEVLSIYIPQLWKVEGDLATDCSDKVGKTGDVMLGLLDMSFNKITNLSNEFPPQQNDVCSYGIMTDHVARTKRKPIISVWASSKNNINITNGKYDWHFGRGSSDYKFHGYKMITSGRVIGSSLSLAFIPRTEHTYQSEVVKIVVGKRVNLGIVGWNSGNTGNSDISIEEKDDYIIGQIPQIYNNPLELAVGDISGFMSILNVERALSGTVSVLIELDL